MRTSRRPRTETPARPIDERVDDLLARMTLEEKVAQMLCVWRQKSATLVDDEGRFDAEKARRSFADGRGLGQVGRPSDAGSGLTARQMADSPTTSSGSSSNTRASDPVIFHEECLHGHAAKEGTSFRSRSGSAPRSTRNWCKRLYAMTAAEARARGTHQALTPVVDVCARAPVGPRSRRRSARTRTLVARMGVAAVRGFQGDAAFGDRRHVNRDTEALRGPRPPESGTNCAPVNVSLRVLERSSLDLQDRDSGRRRPERHAVVQRDRRRAVACQPMAAPGRLRDEWGFSRLHRLGLTSPSATAA